VKALGDQNAAIFAGAGMSIPAGLVDWKSLLRSVARDVGLDVKKEDDLITLAQFHFNERGGRHGINQALVDEFASRGSVTENHRILASLPISTYWTTNYDTIIEEALRGEGKRPDTKITVENLATTLPRRDAVVYKMHGDISLPDKAVITKDDYEAYDIDRRLFSTALQGDLVSKTFLFIGFSFNDPNLGYILSRIRLLLGANRRDHYCLLRRAQRADFKKPAEFQYALARQELQVNDLRRYGIIGLLVDSYAEYTVVLMRIAQRFRLGRVFISGSAANYDPWGDAKGQELVQELSARLIAKGFGLVSGFGLGVGEHVVNGTLIQLEREGTQRIDDRLIMRPFPIAIADSSERKRRWKAYRSEMIAHAGVAVFLFGSKVGPKGKVLRADGMAEEFDLAVAAQMAVLPVGCTGGVAEELFRRVLADFSAFYPRPGYQSLFRALGKNGTPGQVAGRVVSLLEKIRDDAHSL